jgi:formylmethanofuran dehydrogenase subunit B
MKQPDSVDHPGSVLLLAEVYGWRYEPVSKRKIQMLNDVPRTKDSGSAPEVDFAVQVYSDIACNRCGCVCDDLSISVTQDRVVEFQPDCSVANPWFESLRTALPSSPADINGHDVDLEEALDEAARMIRKAQAPLFFGLSRSSTDGQRAVCELADRIGATIDTTASIGHGPSIIAFQNAGESTSTLGEVRHRSDLVIYWACDPLTSHPRHMERFVEAAGFSIPNGRKDRHVVVVDYEATATSAKADTFLRIQKGSDFEVLWTLRALLKGIDINESTVAGVDVDSLRRLVQRMKSSHYGAIFFGVSLTESLTGNTNVEALLRLVTDLNMFTRFVARRMRVPGDVTGADSVLCWQTGYPFSVNLSRGFPRFNPVEYSAGPMLERGETDCVILVGAERVDRFSEAARSNLRSMPVILLDPPNAQWNVRADVRFNTAIYGIHRRATAYRMDEVPVPLRKIINSPLPSDDEVLRAILKRL